MLINTSVGNGSRATPFLLPLKDEIFKSVQSPHAGLWQFLLSNARPGSR